MSGRCTETFPGVDSLSGIIWRMHHTSDPALAFEKHTLPLPYLPSLTYATLRVRAHFLAVGSATAVYSLKQQPRPLESSQTRATSQAVSARESINAHTYLRYLPKYCTVPSVRGPCSKAAADVQRHSSIHHPSSAISHLMRRLTGPLECLRQSSQATQVRVWFSFASRFSCRISLGT